MAEDVFSLPGSAHMSSAPAEDPHQRLRTRLRQARRAIPARARLTAAERLASHLAALPFAPCSGHVAGYWAMDGEIALNLWQLRLPPTVQYCLPVLHDEGCLWFAPFIPGAALTRNRFGIPEPDLPASELLPAEAMALVVLPLVGFDDTGQRLGMGGGWYDRSFAFRRTRSAPPYLVGAGFAQQQIQPRLTPQPWDVGLDAVCCEERSWLIERP